jgi:hypothetical protein
MRCLIGASMKVTVTRHVEMVRNYLIEQSRNGYGSFSLDPDSYFPTIFQDPQNLRALASIIIEVANQLKRSELDLQWDIIWDRETRLRWLAKMTEFHEMITDLCLEKNIETESLILDLSDDEMASYQYYLLTDYYAEICKRGLGGRQKNDFEQDKVDLLTKLIAVSESLLKSNDELLSRYSDRSEIFISQGQKKKAVNDLQKCIQLTNDSEEKEYLLEIISELS